MRAPRKPLLSYFRIYNLKFGGHILKGLFIFLNDTEILNCILFKNVFVGMFAMVLLRDRFMIYALIGMVLALLGLLSFCCG